MNKIGKLMAFASLSILYVAIFHLYGLNTDNIIFWLFYAPVLIGIDWIIEKLDK